MNRVEFMEKIREMAGRESWLVRSKETAELIAEMQEVFDRLEELEMHKGRERYLKSQLHFQQQINFELEYNLDCEEYLEKRLEELRAEKEKNAEVERAEAKRALNAMFGGCTPDDLPFPEVERRSEG